MEVTMLKGKIHRVKVTQAEVDYVGSITIDPELMSAAGIFEYEKVAVVDVTNGARLETYTIAGEPGSGIICLNGAAAKLINKGDTAIIMAYAQMSPEEAAAFRPKVVFVDENNKIVSVKDYERHGVIA
ncbi:MAG TPA: aspartate 1-decarboxylase [Candidatus Ornithomonoglobus merdipullorum]|uniref:Aspartate 1-decarboxylase n=1 Tax=Candidatus Ornithomonoglobus merdipullorum TaxID=2840895 RepID=A0A9D1SFA0_9FIRM|nr:aspartate 1-decarboxylase [Candidatus Ornithomonoglobus merdipullorum]